MNRLILLSALVLALSCVVNVTGNEEKYLSLAMCFNDSVSIWQEQNPNGVDFDQYNHHHVHDPPTPAPNPPIPADTQSCLSNASSCFDGDDTNVITQKVNNCIQEYFRRTFGSTWENIGPDDMGSSIEGAERGYGKGGFSPQRSRDGYSELARIIRSCLGHAGYCIREEARSFIKNKLPACVNTTVSALEECYKTHAEACGASCSESDIPSSNPFSGVTSSNVTGCAGFQSLIMDPSCEIVDCCPECSSQFDDLMSCIGQDLLNLQPGPCRLSCAAVDNSTRRKLSTVTVERKQDITHKLLSCQQPPIQARTGIIMDECALYLDTEEAALTAGAVSAKIVDGKFLGCVADLVIQVAEEQKLFIEENRTFDYEAMQRCHDIAADGSWWKSSASIDGRIGLTGLASL